MSRLHAAVQEASDPVRVMQRVVDEALVLVPSCNGAVVQLLQDEYLTYVCCAGSLIPSTGLRVRLDGSFSGLAVRSASTLRCDDTTLDDRVDRAACEQTGARSAVCVPLLRDGRPLGVFMVMSTRVSAFDDDDVATLRHLADFVTLLVSASADLNHVLDAVFRPDDEESRGRLDERAISQFVANVLVPSVAQDLEVRERVARVIEGRDFAIVFQPIFDLRTGRLVGAEALTRFLSTPDRSPTGWFEEAGSVGLGSDLEIAVLEPALARLEDLPPQCRLALNVGPESVARREFAALLEEHDLTRIMIELTEHVEVADYPELRRALHDLRRRGLTVAIDDTGAGFASLSHIVKLAPDVIKLDLEFTRGVDLDPVRRSLAMSLVAFARDTGATVVAEGIETGGELETLSSLGVALGQGYLLGRPGPLGQLTETSELLSERIGFDGDATAP